VDRAVSSRRRTTTHPASSCLILEWRSRCG
jgi:hypothetical protein